MATSKKKAGGTQTPKNIRRKDDEEQNCGQCKLVVLNADQALNCEICNQWFHASCQNNMNKTKYEFLTKQTSNIHWYCDTCDITASTLLITLASLKTNQEKLTMEVNEIKEQLSEESMNIRIDQRINHALKNVQEDSEWSTIVKNSLQQPQAIATNQLEEKQIVRQSVKEIEERKSRRPNMIIYHYAEHKSQLKEERQKHDLEIVKSLGETLSMNLEPEINKIYRLGKIKENGSPRPLLVALKDEQTKKKLFGQLQSLKECSKPLCEISVQHDMTPTERQESKLLFEEAKSRQQSSGGKWVYKVRGPPWAQRIVRLKPAEKPE